MDTVTVTREIAASPATVRAAIRDVEPFMRAAKFDDVEVDGDHIRITNTVGMLLEIELDLRVVDREDAVLAYEQESGIFDEMTTVYRVDGDEEGDRATVTATTDFEVAAPFVGPLFDATVVSRQRRRELTAQFDYLDALSG